MERGGAATLEATRSWRGKGGAIYHRWEFRVWSWIFLWRRGGGLLAIHENQPYAAHFDQIPVTELGQRADFGPVNLGHEVPTAQVVAVFVLVDLRRNIRREPAAEPDGCHLRTPDYGQFPDQPVFFLVRAPAENGKRRNAQTIRGELRALTGGHCLFEHLAPLASIKHHRFVHSRGRCFVPCVLDKSDIMRLVHEDMMLSDQDGVAVLEHGTLDAYVVQKGPIEAVQVFDHQRSGFHIYAGVVIRNSQIVDGDVVVRRAADRHRLVPERDLLQRGALEFQDESRHLFCSPPAIAERTLSGVPLPDLQAFEHAFRLRKDAQHDYTDVVDAAIFIGQIDEPVRRVLCRRACQDRTRDFRIGHHARQSVRAQQ